MNKDKNQDQELDYRMDSVSENVSENASEKVSENVSDARLSQIFGEALGDEPSKEETLAAWEAFEKKHISSEEEHLQKAEDELSEKKIEDEIAGESSSRKISKARILAWITASVAVAASLFLLFSVHPRRFLSLRSSPWNFSRRSLLPSRWSRP